VGFVKDELKRGFENEVRAYRKLSEDSALDIVRFLRDGKLNADTYFIDMELCIGTLVDFLPSPKRFKYGKLSKVSLQDLHTFIRVMKSIGMSSLRMVWRYFIGFTNSSHVFI